MRGRREERIEAAVDRLAALAFGGAGGLAVMSGLNGPLAGTQLAAATIASAVIAYWLILTALQAIVPKRPSFDVCAFPKTDLHFSEPDELLLTEEAELLLTEPVELLLTEADRVRPEDEQDELILDDIVVKLQPDSRVVRLFDPASMPTAGQLTARIDRHLAPEAKAAASPDAARALHEALAELRRSLR